MFTIICKQPGNTGWQWIYFKDSYLWGDYKKLTEYDYIQNKNKSEIKLISEILEDLSKSEKYKILTDAIISIDILFSDKTVIQHRIPKLIFDKYLKKIIWIKK